MYDPNNIPAQSLAPVLKSVVVAGGPTDGAGNTTHRVRLAQDILILHMKVRTGRALARTTLGSLLKHTKLSTVQADRHGVLGVGLVPWPCNKASSRKHKKDLHDAALPYCQTQNAINFWACASHDTHVLPDAISRFW